MTRIQMNPRTSLRRRLLGVLLGGFSFAALNSPEAIAAETDLSQVQATLRARQQGGLVAPTPSADRWEESSDEVAKLLRGSLTADSAVRVALLNNRELRASFHELGIARGALVQAGLAPNPEIELELRIPTERTEPLQGDVGLEYNLSSLMLRPLRRGVARAELAAERIRVAGEVLDVAYRTRLAFYDVQARQQLLDLRKRALSALEAAYATASELHRAGNLPDLDLALERSAIETGRIAVAEAEASLLDAREGLNVLLGLSGRQTSWTVEARLDDAAADVAGFEQLEQRAVEASLELAELRARLDASSRRVGLFRTEGGLPHLGAGFHGEYDSRHWELGAHVTFGLPIFDRAQGRVQAASAEFQGLRERTVAAGVAVRASLRQARNRVESSAARARHYRDVLLPARERALKETLLQYNAMQLSVFQLLEAQRGVTDAASAYVDTLLEHWRARAALDQILAGRHRGVVIAGAATAGGRAAQGGTAAAH